MFQWQANHQSESEAQQVGIQFNIGGKKKNSQKVVGCCKCIVGCTENHHLCQCDVYRNKSSAEKIEVVQRDNCCLNCLQEGHSIVSYTSEWMCIVRSTALNSGPDSSFLSNNSFKLFWADFDAQYGKLGVFKVKEFIFGDNYRDNLQKM